MSASSGAIRAGRAYVEAFLDTDQFDKQLKGIKGKLDGFAKKVNAIAGTLVGIGAAFLTPMAAGVRLFSAYGAALNDLSDRTGVGVEELSALGFAAEMSGAQLESVERGLASMAKFLGKVNSGARESVNVLGQLGITVGSLTDLSPEQRFLKFAEALSKIPDPTQRAALAMKVFGNAGMELLPLLAKGSFGIQDLMHRARELGLVLSDEDATAARELDDSLKELFLSSKSLLITLGNELVPVVKDLAQWMREAIPPAREWMQENRELVELLAKVAAGLVVIGGTLYAIGGVAKLASTAIGVLTAAKAALLVVMTAISAKAAGFAAAFLFVGTLATFIYKDNAAMKELNRQLERSAELNEQIAAAQDKRGQQKIDDARAIEDPGERRQFLADELEMEEKNLAGINAQIAGQKQLVDQLSPTWKSLWQAGRQEYNVELANLTEKEKRLKAQKDLVAALKQELKLAETAEAEAARRSQEEIDGVQRVLERLNEELATFGLDKAQRAIRELEKLNANEEELAEARKTLADLTAKEAQAKADEAAAKQRERAADEAAKAAESIADILQDLADDVADTKLTPTERAVEQQLRELRKLGASDEQLKQAEQLVRDRESAALGTDGLSQQRSFSAPGGTFSSLASQMFSNGDDLQKTIADNTKQTADNTKKIANKGGLKYA